MAAVKEAQEADPTVEQAVNNGVNLNQKPTVSNSTSKGSVYGAAVVPTFLTLASANTVVNLASHPTRGRSPQPGEVENVTYATGLLGEKVTAADYVRATQTAHRLGRQMAAFHTSYDVLLTPALGTLPPKLGWIDMMMDDVHEYWHRVFHFSPFTVLFNLTGQQAIVLPLFALRRQSGTERGWVPDLGSARRALR